MNIVKRTTNHWFQQNVYTCMFEQAGIMATDEHELYFEVLPHHIRRRSTIKLLKHTALLARKIQDRSKLVEHAKVGHGSL
jgi:hypothetical protein